MRGMESKPRPICCAGLLPGVGLVQSSVVILVYTRVNANIINTSSKYCATSRKTINLQF
jgi:hypothetical protein